MTDAPAGCLSGEEVLALKFAGPSPARTMGQEARLSPHQHAQRNALKRAVGVLQSHAFAQGCELRVCASNGEGER
jgi:hypothetical protein